MPLVAGVWKTGTTLSIDVKTHDDVRAQLSKEVTGAGGVIVGMSQKTSNLEDVFIQLVSNDKGGKTMPQMQKAIRTHPSWFSRFWAIVRYEMLWNIRKKKFIAIIIIAFALATIGLALPPHP